MVYSLINIERVLEAQPEITVLDLAAEAARDHSREKGCTFEDFAALRAVDFLRIPADRLGKTLTPKERKRLAYALEAMEIECGGEHEGRANLTASIDKILSVEAFVEAGLVQAISATDEPKCDHPVTEQA